jgi:hypothetical protein
MAGSIHMGSTVTFGKGASVCRSEDGRGKHGCLNSVLLVIFVGFGLSAFLQGDYADVFVEASPQAGQISGTVSFEGVPFGKGIVHVEVSDARTNRYLAGAALPVDEKGRFAAKEPGIFGGGVG